MSKEEADAATFRLMMRQFAPNIKNMLSRYAETWGESVYNCYLTVGYRTGKDPKDPNNTLLQVHSILSDKVEQFSKIMTDSNYDPNAATMYELFPNLVEVIQDYSDKWSKQYKTIVSIYDLMLLTRYKKGQDINDAASIHLEIKTRMKCAVKECEVLTPDEK